MSGLGWQDAAVGAVVVAALAWLVLRRMRPKPQCGECPGCASGGAEAGRGRESGRPEHERGGQAKPRLLQISPPERH